MDGLMEVTSCITEIEAKVPLVPAAAAPASTRHLVVHPSVQIRCKRCHALGHNTTNCRTKDPVAVKKRVRNNQKA